MIACIIREQGTVLSFAHLTNHLQLSSLFTMVQFCLLIRLATLAVIVTHVVVANVVPEVPSSLKRAEDDAAGAPANLAERVLELTLGRSAHCGTRNNRNRCWRWCGDSNNWCWIQPATRCLTDNDCFDQAPCDGICGTNTFHAI